MKDLSASLSFSPSIPTLPSELLDEILNQELLLQSDLARCCLVSRQFLQFSRPALYSAVDCNILATPASKKLQSSTFKFLRTLRLSPTARHLVKVLAFDVYDENDWGEDWDKMWAEAVEVTSFDEIIVEILDLAPRVTRLALRLSFLDKAYDYVLSDRHSWIELDLPELAFVVGSLPSEEATFKNLKKLSCSLDSSPGSGSRIHLPPYLEALDLIRVQPGLVTIENVSTSPLRFLRIGLKSLVNLPDLPKLPHLQHLYLESDPPISVEDPSTIANILNRLGGLVSLSLYYYQSPGLDSVPAFVSNLLRQLDLPLHRLDFEDFAPLIDLANLLKSDHFKTLRTLGLSKRGLDINDFPKQDLIALSEATKVKGISIEKIDAMIFLVG
ncbi:hypothetical protein JCM5350_005676 [Sporobolomyces pararoseus]